MRAALSLAARGLGETWPNPTVACIIVADDHVIARARTAHTGRPHAEPQALASAGPRARGATAYVTLEPCAHQGQTPPCTQALIEAGITRVVIAAPDPDPRVNGTGVAQLRNAGIDIRENLLRPEAEALNEGFLRRIRQHRPMLTLKLASTLDGRIATRTGHSQWITGPQARAAAQFLRCEHDAILVGIGTMLADSPALTCRIPGARTRPLLRIVADSHARTPPAGANADTIILIRADADPARQAALDAAGATLIPCPATPTGIDLTQAFSRLADYGLTRILVEGGAQLAAALLRDDLVDHIAWFHAPTLIGADGTPAIRSLPVETLDQMPHFQRVRTETCGADMLTLLRRAA